MHDQAKRAAARAAVNLIPPRIDLGIGSGSTVAHVIEELSARMRQGFVLHSVVPSSQQSLEHAKRLNLPVKTLDEVPRLAICLDGADEIDPHKRMIKGGGGAHVRERIVASSSDSLIILADESKLVPVLGTKAKLPVEILPFGLEATRGKLEQLGFHGTWRPQFTTENGNRILDLAYSPSHHPEQDHERIRSVPGVVDTGLFINMAKTIVIAYFDGTVRFL